MNAYLTCSNDSSPAFISKRFKRLVGLESNGQLLALAEDQFDVLVTSDKNLKYQQNLTGRQLAIVQLPTNQVPQVIELAPAVQTALAKIKAGDFVKIS